MPTLATADLGSDEEDGDFVPPSPKRSKAKNDDKGKGKRVRSEGDSASESDSDTDDDDFKLEEGEAKRLRLEHGEAEEARRKKEAEENYRKLMEEADEPVKVAPTRKMVEVQQPRVFAGQTIYETVLLPEDDPKTKELLTKIKYEAREGGPATLTRDTATATPEQFDLRTAKAPEEAYKEANGGVNVASGPSSSGVGDSAPAPINAAGDAGVTTPSSASASANVSAPSTVNKVKGKAPMRRKPRQSLESMSAALDKGKKMTTLEKSAMDWKSHTSADASVQAELEANRRGGGYLEKQSFLERVGERKSETFDRKR